MTSLMEQRIGSQSHKLAVMNTKRQRPNIRFPDTTQQSSKLMPWMIPAAKVSNWQVKLPCKGYYFYLSLTFFYILYRKKVLELLKFFTSGF